MIADHEPVSDVGGAGRVPGGELNAGEEQARGYAEPDGGFSGAHRRRIAGDNDLGAVRAALRQLYRVLKPDSALFMFADRDRQGEVCEILQRIGFRVKNRIVWDKGKKM